PVRNSVLAPHRPARPPACTMDRSAHHPAAGSKPPEKEDVMTSKSEFTEQEWELLREGPPTAGMIAATASSGGTFRESWALAKALTEARQHNGESELLDASRPRSRTRSASTLRKSSRRKGWHSSTKRSHCFSRT